jgi:drug/metabolite transporter (DMT)-like permease
LQAIIAAAAGVALLWGSGWLFIKLGVSSVPPFLFAGVRGILAGLILLALVRRQRQTWPGRRELLLLVGVGILMTGVCNGLVFWGQARLTSSTAALLYCSMPFFTAVFSHFLLANERLNTVRVTGLLLGFTGVWLVLSRQQLDAGAGVTDGKVAVILSAVFWALSLVLNKRLLPNTNSVMMTGVQLLAGGIFLLPLGLLTESTAGISITLITVLDFLMLLFGQGVLAYLCYYYLLSKVGATNVAMLSFVTPTIAVILGVVLLGERPYWQMAAGLVLVAAGIITVNLLGQRERATI